MACVQLRLKDADEAAVIEAARILGPLAQSREVAFIMNDRPDLAKRTGCDGVHVGQDDAPYAEARAMLGDEAIVGVTCRNSYHLAMVAAEAGADYVAFGAFFASRTKDVTAPASLEILEIWQEVVTAPCVAIGGITVENCKPVAAAGADFLAVSSGVWDYADGPAAGVRAFERTIAEALADLAAPG